MLRASTGVVDVAAEIENTPLKPLGATAGRRHLEFALCVCLLLLLLLLSGCVCVCVCVCQDWAFSAAPRGPDQTCLDSIGRRSISCVCVTTTTTSRCVDFSNWPVPVSLSLYL